MKKDQPDASASADEHELFDQAMTGVQPIEHDRHPPEVNAREPFSNRKREREVIREIDALIAGELPLALEETEGRLEAAVPGIDRKTLKRLRRGELAIESEIDLHGLDATSAHARLERFIRECHVNGLRCVRIVHGRGKNSLGGIPVLRSQLPRWLARGPSRRVVLAYTSAKPNDGGPGATYVLLRKPGSRRPGQGPL